jgi:glycosyltransferase involved in cell wall biosynthesis
MFPHPDQPALGSFVLEQVRALRRHQKLDARVVCCRPLWCSSRRPLRLYRAWQTYRRCFTDLRWQVNDEVPVLYLPYLVGGLFSHPRHGATYRDAVLRAAPFVRQRFAFQVVHAHTSYLDGGAGLALSEAFQTPFFITEHTGPFTRLTQHPRIRATTLGAIAGADRVWCVSTALARQVQEHLPAGQNNIGTLPNGVDSAQFRPPTRWVPDPARPKLLAVMSLDENKNPELLLGAFRRVLVDVPGATLSLIGAGPLEARLRELVPSLELGHAVRLLGHCTRPAVAQRMREECDVLVLSSNSETFGVVLIEALASGKPVVATRCGGPADIITEPWLGRLCEPQSEDALAGALTEVIRGLPAADGPRIRRHALDRFDYRHVAQALCVEYGQALAQRRSQQAA